MSDQPSERPPKPPGPPEPPPGADHPAPPPQAPYSPPAFQAAPPSQDSYWSDSAPPVLGAPQGGYGAQPGAAYGAPPAHNPYAPAPPAGPGQPAPPASLQAVEARFGRVATFGERVVAHLIDLGITLSGLVLVILGGIVLAVGGSGTVTLDNGTTAQAAADPVLVGLGIVLLVAGYATMFGLWLWNRVFRMGRTGQSIGKSSQGLMLIDARTGQPIGAGSSFLREVVSGLVNQVVYLSFLWMLWDPDRQTVADKAVHSTVIHVPRDGAPPRPVPTA